MGVVHVATGKHRCEDCKMPLEKGRKKEKLCLPCKRVHDIYGTQPLPLQKDV